MKSLNLSELQDNTKALTEMSKELNFATQDLETLKEDLELGCLQSLLYGIQNTLDEIKEDLEILDRQGERN
ncbi:hypothetical protein [Thiomicrorhabdus indica]|uniref:hypothetical protein n=1 Tax=Thiomicrorhabdus indica TaxID=2267253 RepID=UPI00102DBA31|nr:hypothetical protein [Thiomicrorhabdus indica]